MWPTVCWHCNVQVLLSTKALYRTPREMCPVRKDAVGLVSTQHTTEVTFYCPQGNGGGVRSRPPRRRVPASAFRRETRGHRDGLNLWCLTQCSRGACSARPAVRPGARQRCGDPPRACWWILSSPRVAALGGILQPTQKTRLTCCVQRKRQVVHRHREDGPHRSVDPQARLNFLPHLAQLDQDALQVLGPQCRRSRLPIKDEA